MLVAVLPGFPSSYLDHCCFFFFKQKTAYDMRISDWSSDVCSSDLIPADIAAHCPTMREQMMEHAADGSEELMDKYLETGELSNEEIKKGDRKSVVKGKSVSVRVDLGGRRIINQNNRTNDPHATQAVERQKPKKQKQTRPQHK